MVTGISHNWNPINVIPKFLQPIWLLYISNSVLNKKKTQENRHFPVTILTAIMNVLCVACHNLPGSNAPFCLGLSDSDAVWLSSSRELPRASASLALNTSDPEAVQLDPAQGPSLVLSSRTSTTKWVNIWHFAASTTEEHNQLNVLIYTPNGQNDYCNQFN